MLGHEPQMLPGPKLQEHEVKVSLGYLARIGLNTEEHSGSHLLLIPCSSVDAAAVKVVKLSVVFSHVYLVSVHCTSSDTNFVQSGFSSRVHRQLHWVAGCSLVG